MGRHVENIANHKLNTISFIELAHDLSVRLKATVGYGHINDNGVDADYNFYQEGIISNGQTKYLLRDVYHFERIERPIEYENVICYEFWLSSHSDKYSTHIFYDSFMPNYYYDCKWWHFCRHFMGQEQTMEYIEEYRGNVYKEVEIFGGDNCIYIDTQENSVFDISNLESQSFLNFKANLEGYKPNIDISLWIAQGKIFIDSYPLWFIDDFKTLGQLNK